MYTLHELEQGSPEWHTYRATHFNASDAPAMLGISKYKTRSDFLREKATGYTPDVDQATQARFDRGHAFEAIAREWAEEIIGDSLFPVVASLEVEDLPLSASYDGATMDDLTIFEHKSANAALRSSLSMGIIPDEYKPQMEQQLMVLGAERCLFMASSGVKEDLLYAWYVSDPAVRQSVVSGWKQFQEDVKTYQPAEVAPAVVATAVTALPSISVQVSGSITVKDNMAAFEVALKDFIEHRLIREPKTDQEFADLDLQIKALKGAEAALDSIEVQLLSQVEAIDLAKRQKDMLHKLTRDNRLMAEKLLDAQKVKIRADIVQEGVLAMSEHMASLTRRIGHNYMPIVPTDFPGAIKGKRTMDSLREAVANELTRAKIAASAIADRIQINMQALDKVAADYPTLFPDRAAIVTKAADDLAALIQNRINAENARLDAERTRIREEEQVKAQKEAEAQVAARADAELAIAKAAEPAPVAAPVQHEYTLATAPPTHQTVVPMFATTEAPSVSLGEINTMLEIISISADGLARMGFPVAAKEKAKCLYRASDLPRMRDVLVRHLLAIQFKKAA